MGEIKNILFIHNTAQLGGASNALLDILSYLEKKEFNPVVLLNRRGPLGKILKERDIKTYESRFSVLACYEYAPLNFSIFTIKKLLTFFIFLPKTLITLLIILKRENINLLYLNTSGLIGCVFPARIFSVPIITHIREMPYHNWIGKIIFKTLRIFSKEIFCNSLETKKAADMMVKNSKLVYDWVDADKFSPLSPEEAKKSLNISNNQICIGMANQLLKEKGIFVFFKAAETILSKNYQCKFFYIGKFTRNKDRVCLMQMIEKSGFSEKFVFTGMLKDISKHLAAMDIVISPNIRAEGFGKTIIEAQAMERCLIASDIGPTDELVRSGITSELIEPNNPKALADSIEYFLNNPLKREQFGKNGRQFVIEKFSHIKWIDEIFTTIDCILN